MAEGHALVIEWNEDAARNIVAWKWPDDRLLFGSVVVVRAGQVAVFLRDGKIMGVLEEGRHVLTTANFPWLSDLIEKIPGIGEYAKAFKAEIYFISTIERQGKFGGQGYAGKDLHIAVNFHGDYMYKVDKPEVFLKEYVGTKGQVTEEELSEYLRNTINSAITTFLDSLSPKEFANLLKAATGARVVLEDAFRQIGLRLVRINPVFKVADPQMEKYLPFLSKAENWEQFRQIMQMQAMERISKNLAQNPAGSMGMGMGMGMLMPGMMGMAPAGYTAPAMGMAAGFVPPQGAPQPAAANMKRCPQCGRMVPADAKFCPYCGYKFG